MAMRYHYDKEFGTRLSLGLPPGDPIHRKAAFADLLWFLQGAAAK